MDLEESAAGEPSVDVGGDDLYDVVSDAVSMSDDEDTNAQRL